VAVEGDQPASMSQLAEVGAKKNEQPRECWFVKCILDGHPAIPLAYEGRSRFANNHKGSPESRISPFGMPGVVDHG
jgi:hypothetical protein